MKVDRSIAIPEPRVGRPFKYPWSEMRVGDSFVSESNARILLNAAASYARIRGLKRKYTTRKVEGGTRIWRTE